MKYLLYILPVVLCYCEPQNTLFSELEGQDSVTIVLKDYGLEQVPPQVGLLKQAEEMRIIKDSGWVVFPPASAWHNIKFGPPYRQLPPEVTQLTALKSLSVAHLDLSELPSDLQEMKNLEVLDISFNKLDIEKEKEKLLALPKLKKLTVYMNRFDSAEVKAWMNERPGLEIIYKMPKNE